MATRKKNINNQPKNIRLAFQFLTDAESLIDDLLEDVEMINEDDLNDLLEVITNAKDQLVE